MARKMKSMLKVSAKDAAGRLEFYIDEAMQRPLGIQWNGTTRLVMISLEEYERLLLRDRQVILTKDLDDETLDAILNAEAGEEARRLNYLMDDSEG
jgi:PHD/YefM family antitoxin component YafN of YafNO toxin-antitoxin module